MTRRSFFRSCAALVGAMLLPAARVAGADERQRLVEMISRRLAAVMDRTFWKPVLERDTAPQFYGISYWLVKNIPVAKT